MVRFEEACRNAADQGLAAAFCKTKQHDHNTLSKENHGAILKEVTEQLKSRVASLGVSSISIRLLEHYDRFFWWQMEASWHDVAEDATSESFEARAGSQTVQCPICFEISGAVALVPCGHTMCGTCANRVLRAPCPTCRRQVTAVTMGVYMD
mmetsp:Transcript_145900/g.269052  ORF Transcript_145900/g.269052 Transcript_145900/m.269052 type:complete len:152 (-) Transcript_145900:225-680(-)